MHSEGFVLVLTEVELVKVVFQAKQMVDFWLKLSTTNLNCFKMFGHCNSHMTVLLLIVKLAFGTAGI